MMCKSPECNNPASPTQECEKCFYCCNGECKDEVHHVKCDPGLCARKGKEECWSRDSATPTCDKCCTFSHCDVHSDTCCQYDCNALIPRNKRCSNRKCGNHCDGCQFDKHRVKKYCAKEGCFRRRTVNKRCCKQCRERDVKLDKLDILDMPDALRNLILSYWDKNYLFSSGSPSIPDEKKEDKTIEDKTIEDKTKEATPTALSYIYIPVLNYGDVSPDSYEGQVIRDTYEKELGEFPRQLERRNVDIRYALLAKQLD
jgi:hypothetical protein